MRIRVFDIKSNETIFTGSVKKTDTLDCILRKVGRVDFTEGMEKSYKTNKGKTFNYFNIEVEVL